MADGSRSFETTPDLERIGALYRRHHAFVWRVLRRCGVPEADLDDAVQETFLVLVRRLDDLQGRAAITTWLYAVAVRVASTLRRSRRREDARREQAGEGMHGALPFDPEAELSRAEAFRVLDGLLDELDDPKRTVFVLAELEGVRVPEISRILGVNVRTVHSRLRLARERFGVALGRHMARDRGRTMRARIVARRLAAATREDRAPPSRAKASLAALVFQVRRGVMPTLPGWQTLAVTTPTAWLLPIAATLAVTIAGAGVVATSDRDSVAAAIDREAALPDDDASATKRSLTDEPAPTSEQSPQDPVVATDAASAPPGSLGASRIDVPAAAARSRPNAPPPSRSDATDDPAARDPSSSLAAETELLESARAALRAGDPASALRILDRYAARFGNGLLVDEVRSSRLKALCSAGRKADAIALADSLAAADAGSRWHAIVRSACGG